PAFRVQSGAGDDGGRGGRRVIRVGPDGRPLNGDAGSMADRINDAFFKLLDTNKDGKLSKEELAAAPALLLKADVNDDEMISVDELLGEAGPEPSGDGPVAFAIGGARTGGTGQPDTPLYPAAQRADARGPATEPRARPGQR